MKKIIFLLVIILTSNFYAQTAGAIDPSFSGFTNSNNIVYSTLTQPDGKIIVGGSFTSINGSTSNRIVRLNSNGSKDLGFSVDIAPAGSSVRALASQSDGKIIVVGEFTTVNGSPASSRVIRLNADGTFDSTFNLGGAGANATVLAVAVDSNDKIVIGGNFSTYNGVTRRRVCRLNANGTLDTTFGAVGSGAQNNVYVVTIQNDGKILVGGDFTTYNGINSSKIARLNTDGSVDTSFVAPIANNRVTTIALQTDGKVIYGGNFTSIGGDVAKKYLVRVDANGTLDASYSPYGLNGTVSTISLDSNGKLLIGGLFTNYDAASRNNIARLNADGSLDTLFNPAGTNQTVNTAIIQPDGKILIGGAFITYNGVSKARLVRISGYYATQLNAASCGSTLANWYSPVYANSVASAQTYRFRITQVDTVTNLPIGAPVIVDRPTNNVSLANVAGIIYNAKYQIEVVLQFDNVWEPYYGPSCFVNTTNPVSTLGAQCGTTLTSFDQFITTTSVPVVTSYKFRVTQLDALLNPVGLPQEIIQSANKFKISQFSGALYGTTYSVEVSLRNTDGNYLPYNAACNITTPAYPTTQLQASQCNSVATSNSQLIYATAVSGATAYTFRVSYVVPGDPGNPLNYNMTYTNNSFNRFTLNDFPGLQAGITYSVEVSVKLASEPSFGPYGAVCTITTPGAILRESNTKAITSNVTDAFEANAYPNPFADNFKLNVNTLSQEAITVSVYDMLGKQVVNRTISSSDIESLEVGSNFQSGVYNVIVSQGGETKSLRVIKR